MLCEKSLLDRRAIHRTEARSALPQTTTLKVCVMGNSRSDSRIGEIARKLKDLKVWFGELHLFRLFDGGVARV